jgi:hypothetical protein
MAMVLTHRSVSQFRRYRQAVLGDASSLLQARIMQTNIAVMPS